MATVVYALDVRQGNFWIVPSDCNGTITVECIGPGGIGGTGGSYGTAGGEMYGSGGGAYTKATLTVTSGQLVYLGWVGKTWLNISSSAAPTSTTQGVLADGGANGATNGGTRGGLASNCIPSTGAYSGGSAAYNASGSASGGAAGPNGAGGNGQGGATAVGGSGFYSSPGAGGVPNGGVGGGTGGTAGGFAGTAALIYTDFAGNKYGPSGGGGGGRYDSYGKSTTYFIGGNAVNYGGGGSFLGGQNGLIVITYTSQPSPPGRYVIPIDKVGTSQWRVPDGVTDIRVETIGAGSFPKLASLNSSSAFLSAVSAVYYSSNIAGGGGAYALNHLKVTPGSAVYLNVAAGGSNTNKNTWLNISSNAIPTSLAKGVLAAGAGFNSTITYVPGYADSVILNYSTGGQASDCLGFLNYSGGNGGYSYSIANGAITGNNYAMGNAGGGGAAGPNGPGARGGNGFYALATNQPPNITGDGLSNAGGGGGGGGGANGGTQGVDGTNKNGSSGGSSRSGTAGGAGNTIDSFTPAGNGSNGSGGGSGSYNKSYSTLFGYFTTPTTTNKGYVAYAKGGNGSTEPIPTWNLAGATTYGPGSGGGGAGRLWAGIWANVLGSNDSETMQAGSGGTYGGGAGIGTGNSPYWLPFYNNIPTTAGQGLVVIQYTVTKNSSSTFMPMFM